MITAQYGASGSEVRILARGNFSLGPGGLLTLLAALAGVTLCLAGLLAWQGYWPILAIAIVQIVLVTWILIRAWERTWAADVIVVGDDRIEITQVRHKRERRIEMQTAWAVLEVSRPGVAWYEPKLYLRSRSRRVELGTFLTGGERRLLQEQLAQAIEQHSALQGALNS